MAQLRVASRCGSPVRSTWRGRAAFIARRAWNTASDFAMLNTGLARAIRLNVQGLLGNRDGRPAEPEWREEHASIDVHGAGRRRQTIARKIRLSDNLPRARGRRVRLSDLRGLSAEPAGTDAHHGAVHGRRLCCYRARRRDFIPSRRGPPFRFRCCVLLLAIGTVVGVVFAGLDRDSTLSHITNTEPGSLGVTLLDPDGELHRRSGVGADRVAVPGDYRFCLLLDCADDERRIRMTQLPGSPHRRARAVPRP